MWIVKWLIGAILVLLIIGFAMQNSNILVTVKFWKWQTAQDLPLWVVMYISFAAGILFWVIISIFQMLGLKNENRKVRKELRKLKEELDRLRNVSIEESTLPSTKQNTVNVINQESNKE